MPVDEELVLYSIKLLRSPNIPDWCTSSLQCNPTMNVEDLGLCPQGQYVSGSSWYVIHVYMSFTDIRMPTYWYKKGTLP
jgi:hypothetical protein